MARTRRFRGVQMAFYLFLGVGSLGSVKKKFASQPEVAAVRSFFWRTGAPRLCLFAKPQDIRLDQEILVLNPICCGCRDPRPGRDGLAVAEMVDFGRKAGG